MHQGRAADLGPQMRLALLSAIAVSLTLAACASPDPPHPSAAHLLSGARAPLGPNALALARASARRFASAYARSIYDPSPPHLPAATPAVNATILAAAARIPPSRLRLHPRAATLLFHPLDRHHVSAALTIEDGRSPPFSVGFTLEHRRRRWLVTAISPPG